MTAIGVYIRRRLGIAADHDAVQAGADLLRAKLPQWDEDAGTIDELYWHFASHALFQLDSESWTDWSRQLREEIIAHQIDRGPDHGSWDPVGVWARYGGRAYSTALNTLALESGYRVDRAETRRSPKQKERRHR